MRALIQRVKSAQVEVDGQIISRIGPGILTLLGIKTGDTEEQAQKLLAKILRLRIFEDAAGKMNLSLLDQGLEHLIVSQFTLYGDCCQGNRPGFSEAARPEAAKPLYERALAISRELGAPTAGGQFQAEMQVSLVNDGPVTFMVEAE